jgi:hypothetical protein
MTSSLTAPPRYSQPTRRDILTTKYDPPELFPEVNKAIGSRSYRNFGLERSCPIGAASGVVQGPM